MGDITTGDLSSHANAFQAQEPRNIEYDTLSKIKVRYFKAVLCEF